MEAVQELRRECLEGAAACLILVDVGGMRQAEPAWFDAGYWGAAALPVQAGGRGSAWFVTTPAGEAVLRHYRRGGRVAALLGDRYWWSGEDETRSFREFRLLAELHREGLPVPRPLGARVKRSGPWYRADLLIARIPQTETLAQRLSGDIAALPWEDIGTLVARFHRAGVFHADLNAHNLLLDSNAALWLIDFDRGERRALERVWATRNLERLRRSLRKECPSGQEAMLELGLARMGRAWQKGTGPKIS